MPESVIASVQFTISDMNDIIESDTSPLNPIVGMIWLDTGQTPPQMMRRSADGWEPVGATTHDIERVVVEKTAVYDAILNVEKERITSLVQDVETMSTLIDGVNISQEIQKLATRIEQTSRELAVVIQSSAEAADILQTYQLSVRVTDDGVEISKSNSRFKIKISNDRMSFMEDDVEIAYMSNKELHISNAVVEESLAIGAFSATNNGGRYVVWSF